MNSTKKIVYKTQQKTAMLEFLKTHREELVSPDTIKQGLADRGVPLPREAPGGRNRN